MAYNATVTMKNFVGSSGKKNWVVSIRQTEDIGISEALLVGLPPRARILRFRCQHNSGTAANFEPEIGRSTGWTKASIDTVMKIESVAVGLIDEEMTPFTYFNDVLDDASAPAMYYRTNCDAGSDNDVTTEIIIEEL